MSRIAPAGDKGILRLRLKELPAGTIVMTERREFQIPAEAAAVENAVSQTVNLLLE